MLLEGIRTENIRNVSISCSYTFVVYQHLQQESLYQCAVDYSRMSLEEEKIVEITGDYQKNESKLHMTISDVTLLILDLYKREKLPKGFENFFPNLRGIQAIDIGLKQLTVNDLSPFQHLRFLNIQNNQLKILHGDLFESNPALEVIKLRSNNFNYISPNIFDDLKNLRFVDVVRCKIIDMIANETSQIVNLQKELQKIHDELFDTISQLNMNCKNDSDSIESSIGWLLNLCLICAIFFFK